MLAFVTRFERLP